MKKFLRRLWPFKHKDEGQIRFRSLPTRLQNLEDDFDEFIEWMWDNTSRIGRIEDAIESQDTAALVLGRDREVDKLWRKVWEVEDAVIVVAHKSLATGSFLATGLLDELGGTLWEQYSMNGNGQVETETPKGPEIEPPVEKDEDVEEDQARLERELALAAGYGGYYGESFEDES